MKTNTELMELLWSLRDDLTDCVFCNQSEPIIFLDRKSFESHVTFEHAGIIAIIESREKKARQEERESIVQSLLTFDVLCDNCMNSSKLKDVFVSKNLKFIDLARDDIWKEKKETKV